jgi:pyridoxal 5'-phosphate synthase pdxS subunit
VVNFAAGGIATPADTALMMQLGADGVFVGSGIFKSSDPQRRARLGQAAMRVIQENQGATQRNLALVEGYLP